MTVGQRMKRIRQYRGMTQKQLGILLGFPENTADVRIAQYESGTRTPKEAVIKKLADLLSVSPTVFSHNICCSRDDFMQSIFWLEEWKGGGDIYGCLREWETMKKNTKPVRFLQRNISSGNSLIKALHPEYRSK